MPFYAESEDELFDFITYKNPQQPDKETMAELSIGDIEFFLHVSVKYMNHLISGQRQVSFYSQINVPPGETQVNLVLLSALVLSVSGTRNGIHVLQFSKQNWYR